MRLQTAIFLLTMVCQFTALFSQTAKNDASFERLFGDALLLARSSFYEGKFAEAENYLQLSYFEKFESFTDDQRILLMSRLSEIQIFKRSLQQSGIEFPVILEEMQNLSVTAKASKNTGLLAGYYSSLARAYLYNAYGDSALHYFKESQTLYEDLGDNYNAAYQRAMQMMINQGRHIRAKAADELVSMITDYEEEIEFAGTAKNKMALAFNARHLGRIYLEQLQDLDEAYRFYEHSLRLREEIGFRVYISPSYFSLGEILVEKGNTEEAIAMFEKSLQVAEEVHFVRYLIRPRIKLGNLYLKTGNREKANEYYEAALKAASINQYMPGIDTALQKLAEMHN